MSTLSNGVTGGAPLAEGDLLVQEDLAATLRRYARGGPAGFYQGETARLLLEGLDAADERHGRLTRGGAMTAADLAGYQAKLREPLTSWFRGHEVIGMGPPSSGGVVVLQVLEVLEGFPLDDERESTLDAIETAGVPVGDGSGLSANVCGGGTRSFGRLRSACGGRVPSGAS